MNTHEAAPASYLLAYVKKARSTDLGTALAAALERTERLYAAIPEERGLHRYAPGKWSIKESLQHITDTERVFAYRALRFARNDDTALPSMDEDMYAAESKADRHTLRIILNEHILVRKANQAMFAGFGEGMLKRSGIASGSRIDVRSLGMIIAGHAEHHCDILEQRYC